LFQQWLQSAAIPVTPVAVVLIDRLKWLSIQWLQWYEQWLSFQWLHWWLSIDSSGCRSTPVAAYHCGAKKIMLWWCSGAKILNSAQGANTPY